MKTENSLTMLRGEQKQHDLTEVLKTLEQKCNNCNPLTPLECVTRCNVWKLKNELRKLYDTMENPDFIKDLLNTLKNRTRIHVLKTISKGRYSVSKLQQKLKKHGHQHSQNTIIKEYLSPLVQVGLAAETQNQYYATRFGYKLYELIGGFQEFEKILPSNSECYEETILKLLLTGPKALEELKEFIPAKSISRVLKRLKKTRLIETPKERDYVFFFRTRRDPIKETFSPTERNIYENIPEKGIPARKLAEKSEVSLRRTYKYLRRLKGKKMVFTRKILKTYVLTEKGVGLATTLCEIQSLVEETIETSAQVANVRETPILLLQKSSTKKQKEQQIAKN